MADSTDKAPKGPTKAIKPKAVSRTPATGPAATAKTSEKAVAKHTTKRVKSRRAPDAGKPAANTAPKPAAKPAAKASVTKAKPKAAKRRTVAKAKPPASTPAVAKQVAKAQPAKVAISRTESSKTKRMTSSAKTALAPKAAADKSASKSVKAKSKTKSKAKTTARKPATKPKTSANAVVKAQVEKTPAKTSASANATKTKAAKPKVTKPRATASGKAITAKAIAKSKPAPARPPRTVGELHAHVEKLGERLKRADATTRRNVKALDTTLKAFEKRSTESSTSSRAGLIRRIENVKSQLSALAVDTRVAVRDDLKAALAADSPKRMAEVLFKVDMKMEAAEREQARAVARLNQHLADMARAMDARLVAIEAAQARETEARRQSVDVLTGRIDAVEAETARAVTDIGERMVGLATRLREDIEAVRAERGGDGDAAEIAVRTQTEISGRIDELSKSVDARVERAVRSANDADVRASDIERTQGALVAELTARIEGLEYQLSQVGQSAQVTAVQVSPAQVAAPAVMELDDMVSDLSASTDPVPMPLASFDAVPKPVPEAVSAPAPQPEPVMARDPDLPEHYPVEFVPVSASAEAAMAPTPVIPQPQPAIPVPSISQFDAPAGMPDFAPVPQPLADAPVPMPMAQATAVPASVVPQITDADLPYVDPGYAETDAMSRPGGDQTPTSRFGNITPRTLRVGGLAAGVAIVGAFAISQVVGGPDKAGSNAQVADAVPALSPDTTKVAFSAPKGDLSELSMPLIIDGEPGFDTLEAAVSAGNPVAQYQMGLIRFEDRDIPGALTLIRASADQGLPAAQYRLAKFYEAGQGVGKDLPTAFRLTEMAARQGHRIAMHDTAVFYAQGVGGNGPDHAQAVQWFEKAARLGVLDSQFNIAHLLHTGQELGIQQDLDSAYVWYAVAAQNGDQEAADRMARLREGFTPEQLTQLEGRVANFRTQPMDEAANGIFRDLPWKSPETVTASADRSSVKQVQALLNQLGYDTGTPDGIAGAKTRQAIIEFERSNDMAETGEASSDLLQKLESLAGA